MLVVGLVTIYCFWLMLASASFWLIRMNEVQELFDGIYRAGQYPVGIYPGWLKYGLTLLGPARVRDHGSVGGRDRPADMAGGVGRWRNDGGMLILSRWFWRRGLRRYDGASA